MSSSNYERRLAAILYADVAGYTRLTGLDEVETHRQLAESLDLIADRVHGAGGRVVHYAGDAVLASFDSSVAATNCAIGIQRATAALRAEYDEDRRLLFRVGLTAGEVIVDRGDLYGDDVNLAARLEGMASPGGICVSAAIHEQVAGKVDCQFDDMGELQLKNILRPVRAFGVSAENLQGHTEGAPGGNVARFSSYPVITASEGGARDPDAWRRDQPSLMILPFKAWGEGSEAPLANGLRFAIQSVLVKLSGLFLISPAAPETYRESVVSAVQAGNEVGTRYVLEAVTMVSGDRIRVTAQLTDAPKAQLIWSEQFDRGVDDIFEILDEVATAIVTALHVQLNREDGAELRWWSESLPTWSAREKALRGLSHLYKGTASDNELARGAYEELLAELPEANQGQALALIALTHWNDALRGWSASRPSSLRLAGEFAESALEQEVDPDGWARLVLGYIRLLERKHDEALALTEAVSKLRWSCPLTGAIRAEVLKFCGEPQQAIQELRSAVRKARIYPPWMPSIMAACLRDAGEYGSAVRVAEEALRLDETNVDALVAIAAACSLSGQDGKAREAATRILELEPAFTVSRYCESQPYRVTTRVEEVAKALREAGLPMNPR